MKKVQFFFVLSLSSIVLFMSCTKGDAGPAGPAGDTGATGAAGATGDTGPAGTDSVLYSAWIPVNMSDTIQPVADTTYYQWFTANAITSEILNTGTIVTYLQTVDQNGDSLIFNAATALTESYYVGNIYVASYPAGASNSSGYNYTGYNYRFIVIPGAIASTAFKGMTQQQLQKMSYTQITNVLKIRGNNSNIPARFNP